VICPDLPGRGESDWLPSAALYEPVNYVQALAHLLAAVGEPVAWIGTSLGGICGMAIAAAGGSPVTRLVLNDIGPVIAIEGLQRIHDYMPDPEKPSVFRDLGELEQHLRAVHAPFGPITDAQWAHMARTSARMLADGTLALHFDPKIAAPVRAKEPKEVALWPIWQQIRAPVLAIRGEKSDLLRGDTLALMEKSGARTLTVPGVGHVPSLMDAPTIGVIRQFLLDAPVGTL
jgi:pimeloyl-ACP methyl ester carboxylesterase